MVAGVPPEKLSAARGVLQGNDYSNYDVASTSDGNSTLTMKPSALRDLETRTLETSIETIRARIDKLGVAEPVIQKYGLGANQILVELPGLDDPARVEEVIQSTAKLSIHAVAGGPTTPSRRCCRPIREAFRLIRWCSKEPARPARRSRSGCSSASARLRAQTSATHSRRPIRTAAPISAST